METNAPDPHEPPDPFLDRRAVLKLGALVGLGAAVGTTLPGCASRRRRAERAASAPLFVTPPLDRVRIGFVGVGNMGTHHVATLLKIRGAEIRAVCDIRPERADYAAQLVTAAGQAPPTLYTRGERDFERLCGQEELDLVFTATPWEWHVPVCLAAMRHGKHAATEVPAATTVDGCWELVETAERTGRHCIMMENCCYDRAELLCLNLVRQGLLGEVLHGECGYLHDLRPVKFDEDGEGWWRRPYSRKYDANLYPTHGLGPVAQNMNINRGDRFEYLVSMSGPSRGLQLYQQEVLAPDDPRRAERFVLGDVNTTLIRTELGRTIYLVHDTNLPRPYSRKHTVQGTRGIFEKYPPRVHIEGRSQGHGWETLDAYAEFEHPLWKSETVQQAAGGHGGMDFLENYRLIHCLRHGLPLDMDVYDAAAWSVVFPLTAESVAKRSRPVEFPDFTRGKWRVREPLGIVEG
ncbi:MAG: Gfo/Idh/MocA family oxidoreductase [Phycisphaerales bacterium]|nr:Gfo/Idh/MocA family oxidoreductase [Phycisphaerales bacterium]